MLGETGVHEILNNPLFRSHVMAVRSRHVMASERRIVLGAALLAAAMLNAVSRSTLGWSFERALFYDARDLPPFFDVDGFPLQRIPISAENLDSDGALGRA